MGKGRTGGRSGRLLLVGATEQDERHGKLHELLEACCHEQQAALTDGEMARGANLPETGNDRIGEGFIP